MMFKFHYPARGRKLKMQYYLFVQSRSNSITPRGDGNLHRNPLRIFVRVEVQIPLPREGTETLTVIAVVSTKLVAGSNSITPRGDGNILRSRMSRKQIEKCSNSITPRGDGNLAATHPHSGVWAGSNSITPRGDGNSTECSCSVIDQ